MIKILCTFLDAVINPTIFVVAIVEFLLLCISFWTMAGFRRRINKLSKKSLKKTNTLKKEGKGKIEKTIELESNLDWEKFDQFLEDYQRKGCCYSAYSLIIQTFTLLGILGTVVGLYIAMSNGENMYQGVELSLSSTILGILFAVIYKVFDIFIVSVFINYIDDGICRYESIYKVDNEDAAINAVLNKNNLNMD